MTHNKVYENFKKQFAEDAFYSTMWFPNGKNSVRIRRSDGQDFVYTYNGKNDWCYESEKSYIRKMEARKAAREQESKKGRRIE